jgi:hypothetical protein
MRQFGLCGDLEMIEFSRIEFLTKRRFFIGLKLVLGSGYWLKRLARHVCSMNGVLIYSIV